MIKLLLAFGLIVVRCEGQPVPNMDPGDRLDILTTTGECDSGTLHGPIFGIYRCEDVDF